VPIQSLGAVLLKQYQSFWKTPIGFHWTSARFWWGLLGNRFDADFHSFLDVLLIMAKKQCKSQNRNANHKTAMQINRNANHKTAMQITKPQFHKTAMQIKNAYYAIGADVQNRNANHKESNGNLFQNHKEIIRNLMGKSTGISWNLYENSRTKSPQKR
jgi:hypothetical protein